MSSGYIALGLGGLSNPMTTAGDMIYGGTAGLATRLGIGTSGQVLSVSAGGIPEWATITGTGSVTSVGMTVPSFLSVAGSPITTAGSLDVTLATQVMNTIFAGPTAGADATPAFRALVAADIPSLPASIITSGTLAVARGGTNLGSGTSGGILGYTAAGVLASSVALTASALVLGGGAGATPTPMGSLGTTTTVLHGNAAGAPTFAAVSLTADVSGTLPFTSGGFGIATATSGGIPYFSSSTTVASSAALTASRIVLGGGAGAAPTVLGSLGTTTTVLHGNAAGAPTFGAVSLTADVSGNLPVTNLNSGTSAGATTFWRGDGTWSIPAGTGLPTTGGTMTGDILFSGSHDIGTTTSNGPRDIYCNRYLKIGSGSRALVTGVNGYADFSSGSLQCFYMGTDATNSDYAEFGWWDGTNLIRFTKPLQANKFVNFGIGATGPLKFNCTTANAVDILWNTTDTSTIGSATACPLSVSVGSGGVAVLETGSNKKLGSAVLVGGTVTVSNTSVSANTRVFLTRSTTGGVLGNLSTTKINATSFTINSDNIADTSTVNWLLIEAF